MIDFGAVIKLAFGIVFMYIILSVGGMLLGGMRDTMTENTTEYNLTGEGLEQVEAVGDWGDTLVTIGISVVILFLVVGVYIYIQRKNVGG